MSRGFAMTVDRRSGFLAALISALVAGRGWAGDTSFASNRQAATSGASTANAGLIGGWFAETELEGKRRGHWLQLTGDRTWRRIEDYFGFRAEDDGQWTLDGDGAVLGNPDVRLRLREGKLLLYLHGDLLYTFTPCPTMPEALRDLPAFPHSLSETVAILSAELGEPERSVVAGTLEQDLSRFHDGLGTYIRNHFGLWGPNLALVAACKVDHPDDASAVILRALRDHLRGTRPNGRDLDRLERVLGGLTLAPIPIRQMTAARFVTSLNHELRRALRRDGHAEEAVVVELAPPKDEQDRRWREQTWLNAPPGLRTWGQRERTSTIGPVDLLPAFKRWLVAPNRLVLEPDKDSRWFQSPDRSPDFVSARWQGYWFEIETSREGGAASTEAPRVDVWSMLGDAPPMPVEAAAGYARVARERMAAGNELVEIAIAGSPVDGTWRWTYRVFSRTDGRKEGLDRGGAEERGAGEAMSNRDLAPKSQWPDPRKPPGVSPAKALALFGLSLTTVEAPASAQIRLRRAGWSKYWYYQVSVTGRQASASGFVTLDGRVRRVSDETFAPAVKGK